MELYSYFLENKPVAICLGFFFLAFVEFNFPTDKCVNCLLFKQLQESVLEISITHEGIKSDYCHFEAAYRERKRKEETLFIRS